MTDRSAFDGFVHARGPALARTAYLLTGDHHLAEDLVQAALVQAAKHWERIETSPEAYVRRTMYHQNISWWRRRKLAETSKRMIAAPAYFTQYGRPEKIGAKMSGISGCASRTSARMIGAG